MTVNVFEINDLRRLIFSYLRKKPKHQCEACQDVCVWDTRTIKHYVLNGKNVCYCTQCYWNRYNGPGCIMI